MKKDKRGISGIVTTVLLILIAITAVALIAAFLIPFINKSLEGGGCVDVLKGFEVLEATHPSADNYNIIVKRGFDDAIIEGFYVTLIGDEPEDLKVFKHIIPSTATFNEGETHEISIDESVTFDVNSVKVAPLLQGEDDPCAGVTEKLSQ